MFLRVPRRHISISSPKWAGHNKWSKIKDKKGANDASKSVAFQRATQDILVAARSGGVDPEKNTTLAAVLKRLKAQDVPKDNIAKALAKAAKVKGSGEILTYEAIACNSVGVIIECATDNANRTVQTLREILNSRNARMASVGYMFTRSGVVVVGVENGPDVNGRLDAVTEVALSEGIDDFEALPPEDDSLSRIKFYCETSALAELTDKLSKHSGVAILESKFVYNPTEKTTVSDQDAEILEDLVHALEVHDDVIHVTTSAAIS
ncbi:transcriptional regulator TACO1-like protein [Lentinula edodes]|uniref:transcriptional regulator TACO1-like protein n=1 Tax=Lentinula edodes TaxID=5353 RepID=UPI001E8EDD85|nr:transcriptional regulator TACO1-like protein [Lentinula edodes]KAH7877676.1 transcriptional regulator TACO1-like protein [Lentinula edodes]